MTQINFAGAEDEIQTLFFEAWQSQPNPLPVFYENIEEPKELPNAFARFRVLPAVGFNAAIGNEVFGNGGLVSVQILTPFGQSLGGVFPIIQVAVDAFRGKATPSGIFFRDVRFSKVGRMDSYWHQTNVTGDYDYYERV